MAIEKPTKSTSDGSSPFEIKLSPDERLNLAYSPNYASADELHDSFLEDLIAACQKGGRGRCWKCNSVAVEFFRLRTAVGLFALGLCDNCGSWGIY